MHFLALRGINRTARGTKLLLTVVLTKPVNTSFTEGIALLFESEWLL